MKLLTIQTLPRYEHRTDEWLPSPQFKVAKKEVMAIASLIPFVLFAVLFSFLPNGRSPLFGDPWALLLAAVIVLPLHELCHALMHPGFGFTAHTRFGFDSNVGPFCTYTDAMSVERFQAAALTPFVLLTVIPLVFQCLGYGCDFVRAIATINASAASIDILMVIWLRKNIPAGSLIASDGAQGIYLPSHHRPVAS